MEASALPRRHVPLTRSRRLLAVLGDDKLVDQLRRGNETAFEVIYDRHHRGILAFCRHMLGSQEEAEDAVQQTFVNAYRDLLANEREIRLKAWLYTIARNRSLSMLRARREQPAEIPDIPTAGLADEVQQRADLQELVRDLHELPEEQRAALILSEIGDLAHAEIARVLEVDAMKVKSLVFQARSSLIETKNAREIPCTEIREQLATLRGGALRRGPLRRHLRTCEGCREFRDEVRGQRAAMAAILPVIPSIGLKESALAAVGAGGGAAGGGLAATGGAGGLGALLGGGAAKVATVAVLAGGAAVGGGVAIEGGGSATGDGTSSAAAAEQAPSDAEAQRDADALLLGGGGAGGGALADGDDDERGKDGEGKHDDHPGTNSQGKARRVHGENRVRGNGRKYGHSQQRGERRRTRGDNGQRGERRARPQRPAKPPRPVRTPIPEPEETTIVPEDDGTTTEDTTTRGGDKPPKPPEIPEADTLPEVDTGLK